jgi:hypothetical protein
MPSVLVEPAYHTAPGYAKTLGPEVGRLNDLIGFGPDAEQQLCLDDAFALNAYGKSAAFELAVIACRQNLKTGLLKQMVIGWLFVTDERLIVWSAHEFRTAQEAFRDVENLIMSSPMLARRVAQIHRGNGDEAIELVGGQRLIFKARTKGGGRGLTGSKVVLDEAYALNPSHMGALLPTLSAVPDPQVVYASSAGQADSLVLRGVRDRGRIGDPRMAYAEWCAPQGGCLTTGCDHALTAVGCALDDVENWHKANPTLGKRISVEYVASERRGMAAIPEEFARERLGWWDEPSGEAVISPESWASCLDLDSQIVSSPSFALDVSPTRTWSAIAVAGLRADGLPHVEITSTEDGYIDHRPGTDWVVPRLASMAQRNPGMKVTIAAGSAAESLVPALTAAGVEVETVKGIEIAAACGLFYDLATTRGLRQIGQLELTTSLATARKNVDEGEQAWRWGRRRSASDITPLYAGTLALWMSRQSVILPDCW